MKYGSLGGGAAMADSDIDQMIADADPKSKEAMLRRQQVVQQRAAVGATQASSGNTTRNVLLVGAALAGAYYLMTRKNRD